jgi:hypothetical protein
MFPPHRRTLHLHECSSQLQLLFSEKYECKITGKFWVLGVEPVGEYWNHWSVTIYANRFAGNIYFPW